MRRGTISQDSVGTVQLTQLCGVSPSRVLLQLGVNTGIGFATDLPGAPAQSGYPITPSSPLTLTKEQHGDLVTHSFFGSSASGTVIFGVIEVNE